jgi:hypothetical protein
MPRKPAAPKPEVNVNLPDQDAYVESLLLAHHSVRHQRLYYDLSRTLKQLCSEDGTEFGKVRRTLPVESLLSVDRWYREADRKLCALNTRNHAA